MVDAIYWLLSAAAKVTTPTVACTACSELLLSLSLPLQWCGQSGMDDCIGKLFMEMLFAAGVAVAPFW